MPEAFFDCLIKIEGFALSLIGVFSSFEHLVKCT